MLLFGTVVTDVSDEARELIEGGVMILFAEGAPPELAEVSVLHRVYQKPAAVSPAVGAILKLDAISTRITAIGEYAWKKIDDIGHVVINFNGSKETPRPGEITAEPVDLAALSAVLAPGVEITINS